MTGFAFVQQDCPITSVLV